MYAGLHMKACVGIDQHCLGAGRVAIRDCPDFMHQNRLVLLKPYGRQEEARQITTRSTVSIEEVFPRVGRGTVHVYVVN